MDKIKQYLTSSWKALTSASSLASKVLLWTVVVLAAVVVAVTALPAVLCVGGIFVILSAAEKLGL